MMTCRKNPFVVTGVALWVALTPSAAAPQQAPVRNLAECIQIERSSNTLTDFLGNRCDVTLLIKWWDDTECKTLCALVVAPGQRQSAGKFGRRVRAGACLYPNPPITSDSMFTYRCPTDERQPPRDNEFVSNVQAAAEATRVATAARPAAPTRTSNNTRMPVRRRGSDPIYPPAALRAGIEGWVSVELTVRRDGSVTDVRLVEASDQSLMSNTIASAVATWRYTPGTVDGQPADFPAMKTRLRFALDGGAPPPAKADGGFAAPVRSGSQGTGGVVVLSGTNRAYGMTRTVGSTGRNLEQARDNARRRFSSDSGFASIFPVELLSCGNGGWFAIIRGFSSLNQIGRNDVERLGAACGKGSREEAVAAAMRDYYRAGGLSGLDNATSSVGFASGTDFIWSGESGRLVTGASADRLQPCPIDQPCEYGPAIYWRDHRQ